MRAELHSHCEEPDQHNFLRDPDEGTKGTLLLLSRTELGRTGLGLKPMPGRRQGCGFCGPDSPPWAVVISP